MICESLAMIWIVHDKVMGELLESKQLKVLAWIIRQGQLYA